LKTKLNRSYEIIIDETQTALHKGRSCADGCFPLKLLIEKHKEFNLQTHTAFIDSKKAFDRVGRNLLLGILKKDHVPYQLMKAIYNICKVNLIAVLVQTEDSEWGEINQGVCQGCSLSSLLFIIYVNEIMLHYQPKGKDPQEDPSSSEMRP
jgi:hypothetical protein